MNIADEASGGNREVNILYRLIGEIGRGLVVDHQQHAGDDGDNEAGRRHQPESEGERGFQGADMHAHAVDVQKEVMKRGLRFFALGFGRFAQAEARLLHGLGEFAKVVQKFSGCGFCHGVPPTRGSACPPGLRCRH